MDERSLSERDICTKYITPAIKSAGWDVHTQLRENVHVTAGRVVVRGRMTTRGKAKFADYVLYYNPKARRVQRDARCTSALREAREPHYAMPSPSNCVWSEVLNVV